MSNITNLSGLRAFGIDDDREVSRIDNDPGNTRTKRFYGKYRGTVTDNADPNFMGRIILSIPDVLGSFPSSWALPCVPMAGLQMGMFSVPPVGADVWVEFEQGNPDQPIWSGCFWAVPEKSPGIRLQAVPVPPGTPATVITNPAGLSLAVTPDAISLTNATHTTQILFAEGTISIIAPTIIINGASIDFNKGTLTIVS